MRRVLLAGLAALVAAGCQVRTTVDLQVEEDGSGQVVVGVGLDESALAELPDLDQNGAGEASDLTQLVRVDDLRATGWDVGTVEAGDDGFTWLRVTKPFGTPDEAVEILTELTGAAGPLRDWTVERTRSFGRTEFAVSGVADLSGGLEVFGDEGLAAALDGEPLGEDAAVIEQRFGRPLGEMVTLEVRAALPGASTESWTPVLGGESVAMEADSTVVDWPVLLLSGLAAVCLVALLAVLGLRVLRR